MRLPSMAKARKICQELKAIRNAGAIRALANALDYAALLRFMHKALAARADVDSVIGRFPPAHHAFAEFHGEDFLEEKRNGEPADAGNQPTPG